MLVDADLYDLKERCALYLRVIEWIQEQDSTNREAIDEVRYSGDDDAIQDAIEDIVLIPEALQISEERVEALVLGRLDQFSRDELQKLVMLVEIPVR